MKKVFFSLVFMFFAVLTAFAQKPVKVSIFKGTQIVEVNATLAQATEGLTKTTFTKEVAGKQFSVWQTKGNAYVYFEEAGDGSVFKKYIKNLKIEKPTQK